MKKVSVIIPVYNASKYLDRCLDSIAQQTYRNLELLFVDDCGTDGSIAKIKDFAKRNEVSDLDIKILLHERNRGVAAARNTALDAATGEYIYSIDADDYLEPEAIELMVKEVEKSALDIVGIEWMLTFEKNERHMRQPDVSDGESMFKSMCYGVMRWNLWLFMIRRELIEENHLRFTEGMNMGEDMMLMLKLSMLSKKVCIIHKPLYHYVNVATSVSRVWSKELIKQITNNVTEVEHFLNGRYELELGCLKQNQKLPLLISLRKEDYETWSSWFPEANKYILDNNYISLRTKVLQYAASKRQFWYVRLYYCIVIKFVYGIIYK